MAIVMMEQVFNPPLSDEEYAKMAAKVDPCLDQRNAIWIRSYISADKTRCVCEFEAPDAESVREAFRSAGAPFERIWTAGAVPKIEDYPEFLKKRDKVRARLAGK